MAREVPRILSPCLHTFPVRKSPGTVDEKVSQHSNKPSEMLAHSWEFHEIVDRRSQLIRYMREWLQDAGYMEVQTPILSNSAGGAIARSFKTSATEFPDRKISLRVAPELWLKRLVLGGLPKVFEIGPCFRNEGD